MVRKKKYEGGARPNEIACYGLHILQENNLEDLMTAKCESILNKYKIVGIYPSNPYVDLTMFLFYSPEDRNECGKELEEMGIKVAYEMMVCYVEKKYIGGN